MKEARYIHDRNRGDDAAAAAFVEVFLSKEGKVLRCHVLDHLGSEKFSKTVCSQLAEIRHENGRRRDGSPSPSLIKATVLIGADRRPMMTLSNELRANYSQPDKILTVKNLPNGKTSADFRIIVEIDNAGAVVQCASAWSQTSASPLVSAACSNHSLLKSEVMTDEEGNALAYVRALNIRMVVEPNEQSSPAF